MPRRASSRDALSGIAEVAELTEGLALVLCAGPDYRAEEAFALISAHLPASRPRIWHRLDWDGPDLPGRLREVPGGAILFVHGFEYLPQEERREIASRLNLLRDALLPADALVLLWLPRSKLLELQRECADLFQWRALLCELSSADVVTPPDLERRRRYLSSLILDAPLPGSLLIEPRVRIAGTGGPAYPIPLFDCLERILGERRGPWLLHKPLPGPGEEVFRYTAGHTCALWLLAGRLARAALRDTGPAPVLISATDVPALERRLRARRDEALHRAGDAGRQRVLLIGDLDFFDVSEAQDLCRTISGLCERDPGWVAIAVSAWRGEPYPQGWARAELCPFNAYQAASLIAAVTRRPEPEPRILLPAPQLSPAGRVWNLWRQGLCPIPERMYEWEQQSITALDSLSDEVPSKRQRPALETLALHLFQRGPRQVELAPLMDEIERDLGVPIDREVVNRELASKLWLALLPGGRADLLHCLALAPGSSEEAAVVAELELVGIRPTPLPIELAERWRRGGRPSSWPIDHLAACALVARGEEAALAALRPHLDDRLWEEVLIGTIARLVRLSGRAGLIWDLLWPAPGEARSPQALRRMALALETAAEAFLPAAEACPYRLFAERVLEDEDDDSDGKSTSADAALARSALGCALAQLP